MRRKVSRLRLSPNEETQLLREELENRRRLRLQQVREQERRIAQELRRRVQECRQQQLQTLAHTLQQEWQQQHTHTLQALSSLYQHSLSGVGRGHRSAQQNEPDVEAWAQRSVEQQQRAQERHQEALRKLSARRQQEQQQQCRHIEARRKALVEEKRRAERVASLPPPPPNPVEGIGKATPRPLPSAAAAERFSATHCHMTQPAVEREMHTEPQLSGQQVAALEEQRLQQLQQEEARERQRQQERARARGGRALRREQHTQDRARLLGELERLQQADLLRRRQTVSSVPAQVFQPLYRQQELRDEQQRDLEGAFQDAFTAQRKVKGDLVLPLVPEPLPALSSASLDEELDVTLDPEGEEPETPEPDAPGGQPIGEQRDVSSGGDVLSCVPADPGRRALRKLLDRIRSQRERQRGTATPLPSPQGESVETGSLSSRDKTPEQQTPSLTHTDDTHTGPDESDEAVVAGALLPAEERERPRVSETTAAHQEDLLRRQQEQLRVLEELDQKRRELEQRLRASQQMSERLQDPVIQESAELPQVDADELHTQRLHQYQQRLLQQNRLHRKSVEEARRRLQEYQHTLKLRHAVGGAAAAPVSDATPPPDAPHPGQPPASQCPAQVSAGALPAPPESDAPALPAPAVVLELLRSRLHQPPPADITSSGAVQTELRRQRDVLQALITADVQASLSGSGGAREDHMTIGETVSQTRPPAAGVQRDGGALTLSNDCVCAPVHRGRGRPPVSRPPVRLRQMEQHELSAIQEVDTPLNISVDTELQSESSDGGHSPRERSQVTGRVGRMSWREMLLQESTASPGPSGEEEQEEEEQCFSAALPSVDPDHLSSTTISTGSYLTSDLEADEPDVCAARSQDMTASVQRIIDRYSRELSASLTHTGPAGQSWSSVLQQDLPPPDLSSTLVSAHTGSFLSLQPHPDVDSSPSSSSPRDGASRRAQGWSDTVTRLLERLSDQLSVRRADPPWASASSRLTHESSLSSGVSGAAHVSASRSSADLQDPSADGCQSVVIGRASDMGSSQVFDQSTEVVSGGPALRSSRSADEDSSAFTDTPHDDASDLFLPLPSDPTHDESVERWRAPAAEPCEGDESLQQLRADTLMQSHLQTSTELLSLTQQSLCETASPLQTDTPAQEVRSALSQLLDRAQAVGDVKGILEESAISFISLPDSTLPDPDAPEDSEPQEARLDLLQGEACGALEPSPHAVMLLEFKSSPAQRQRREGLAQRSALRAAQVKASRLATALRPDAGDTPHTHGLKSVAEVRICSAAQRRVEEPEMRRRTERLYSQLEEVKQQKQIRSRQEAYAKNREKARDFQRKTLERLRGKLKS